MVSPSEERVDVVARRRRIRVSTSEQSMADADRKHGRLVDARSGAPIANAVVIALYRSSSRPSTLCRLSSRRTRSPP